MSLALAMFLVAAAGCKEPSRITQYEVPKSQSDMDRFSVIGSAPASETSSTTPSKWHVPEGWTYGGEGSFGVRHKFSKEVVGESVEISVSTLAAGAADWHANVTRWASRQLGVEVEADAIDQRTLETNVDGSDGKLIQLFDEGTNEGKAIIGAMVVRGDDVWFFKSFGKAAAVKATESEFNDYLKSFKFP